MCLQPAERDLSTPEGIKKYRKSFKEQCGVTIVSLLLSRCIQDQLGNHYHLQLSPTEYLPRRAKEPAIFLELAIGKALDLLSKIYNNVINTTPSKGNNPFYKDNLSPVQLIANIASQTKRTKKNSDSVLQLRPINGASKKLSIQHKTCHKHKKSESYT